MLFVAIAALSGQLLLLLGVWWNRRATPDASGFEESLEGAAGSLLVVVPARDEAANIELCIASLRASNYPHLTIRVVDDHSSDSTLALARAAAAGDARVEIVSAPELPVGWLGKNHALHFGTRGAVDDWLLFMDADVRISRDCLGRAMTAAKASEADLFTLWPRSLMVTFWEQVAQSLIVQLVVAWLPAQAINDPHQRRAGAIGPFMLFRRSAYERIGGHEAVRGEVVEDLRLADLVKKSGLRIVLMRGIDLAAVRMYNSLKTIVRGWSKNFHVALGPASLAAPLVALALLVLFAGPFAAAMAGAATGAWRVMALGIAATATAIAARWQLARWYGVAARGVLLMPLGALVVAWILVASSLRTLTGRSIEWKGRAVK